MLSHVLKTMQRCRGHMLHWDLFVPVLPYPIFIFHISLSTLHSVLASKAQVHKKIIFKWRRRNEGANSDEYQILLIYSWTISLYKRKWLWGLNKGFQFRSGLHTDFHTTENSETEIFRILHNILLHNHILNSTVF